jgi:hypothetical protein
MLRRLVVNAVCPGWSRKLHWDFFHRVLRGGRYRKVAILGVYQGRDIAYMASAFRAGGVDEYTITGVDRFADVPGEDWPDDKKRLSWREAGFGQAPTLDRARRHLARLGCASRVRLVQGEAELLLEEPGAFDLIYIDISHDYASTVKAIGIAAAKAAPGALLCGDDFSDVGTWGVAAAVREHFSAFDVHGSWVWSADAAALKAPPGRAR